VKATVTRADESACEAGVEVVGPGGVVGRGTLVQRYIRQGQLT